jgi:hypothetical protein
MFETSSAGPPGFLPRGTAPKREAIGSTARPPPVERVPRAFRCPVKHPFAALRVESRSGSCNGLVPLGSSNVNFDHRSAESESCPLFVLTFPLCPPCLLCSTDVRQSSCRHLGLPCGGNRHDLFAFDLRPSRALSRSDLCASFLGHFAGACSAVRSRSIQDGQRPTKDIKFRGEAAAFFLKVGENFGYV